MFEKRKSFTEIKDLNCRTSSIDKNLLSPQATSEKAFYLFGLVNDLPYSDDAKDDLADYAPKSYNQVFNIKAKKSKSCKRKAKDL
jgi:hypothetical protein